MLLYSSLSQPELKALCKTRKLRVGGAKEELESRLLESDWNTWLSQNSTFNGFTKLPLEIQISIWQLSLPGPRVLSTTPLAQTRDGKPDTERWGFPKNHHTPNPAALSVCRTSRTLALKRYRLVFGSACCYADLPGGDIVYFGPWNHDIWPHSLWSRIHQIESEDPVTYRPVPALVADMEQIRHMAWDWNHLAKYTDSDQVFDRRNSGLMFVYELSGFKNLETLSICCGGSNTGTALNTPGRVVIEEDEEKFSSQNRPNRTWSGTGRKVADAILKSFYEPLEKREGNGDPIPGMPHLQLVEANRLKVPKRSL